MSVCLVERPDVVVKALDCFLRWSEVLSDCVLRHHLLLVLLLLLLKLSVLVLELLKELLVHVLESRRGWSMLLRFLHDMLWCRVS